VSDTVVPISHPEEMLGGFDVHIGKNTNLTHHACGGRDGRSDDGSNFLGGDSAGARGAASRRTSPPKAIATSSWSRADGQMKKAKRKTKSPRASSAVDQYIGARILERRLALNMSQADLGEKLGVTFQ
jgi:hypothetical protein